MTAPATTQNVVPWATQDQATEWTTGQLSEQTLDVLDDYLQVASNVLYQLSGRRWAGVHTRTIRPLCGCTTGCDGISVIRLPGFPVAAITSVNLNIMNTVEVLDPARYRVDNRRDLVYLPALTGTDRYRAWPCTQQMERQPGDLGTWSVTYTCGRTPPIEGQMAAATLAVELAVAAQVDPDRPSRLPDRVTSITRQGVAMAILDPLLMFEQGKTGVASVDAWLGWLRYGQKSRAARVLVPGLRRPREQSQG